MAMMANNPSAFIYQRLPSDHIRLLRISQQYGKLVGQLSHVNLASAPKYLTLSYTWNDQPRDQNFLVDGAVLKIIQNVKFLLPRLLEKYPYQYFWIDGICIDQESEGEQQVQIPLMRTIYTKAAACIVWLGESSPLMDQAIPRIPELAARFQGYDFSLGLNSHSLAARGLPDLSSPIWAGIDELFCKDWFTRVWTFQEAVLPGALEVLCGEHFINTNSLVQLASSMISASDSGSHQSMSNAVDDNKLRSQVGMSRVITISTARYQRTSQSVPTYTFLDLLAKSLDWKSSKPLDKVYGLLGLADKSLEDELGIDYSRTMPDLYFAFAKCWIPRTVYLEILHMISSSYRTPGVPSWCPTFDPSQATSFGLHAYAAQYRAGFKVGRNASIALVADSRAIRVEGFHVDEIAEVLPCPWERQIYGTAETKGYGMARLLEWEMNCLELSRRVYSSSSGPGHGGSNLSQMGRGYFPQMGRGYFPQMGRGYSPQMGGSYLPQMGGFTQILRAAQGVSQTFSTGTPDDVPDAHWRTLIANKHANGQRYAGRGKEAYHLAKIEISKLTTTHFQMSPEEQRLAMRPFTDQQLRQAQDYSQSFGYGSHGRSFLSTRGGRVGLGPLRTKPGDLICIFYNGCTPYIIRPIQEGQTWTSYEFVGESYVDGLMYGEAFRMRDKKSDQFLVLE